MVAKVKTHLRKKRVFLPCYLINERHMTAAPLPSPVNAVLLVVFAAPKMAAAYCVSNLNSWSGHLMQFWGHKVNLSLRMRIIIIKVLKK